jgi:hypothetical protein
MRPLKAGLFFLYCLAALTAVGTAVSHLWRTAKLDRAETRPLATAPAPAPATDAPAS